MITDREAMLEAFERARVAGQNLAAVSEECCRMSGDIHDLLAENAALRERMAIADAKLSRLSQLADRWSDRGGYAKGVFSKDLRNVLAGTVGGGPQPLPAAPEVQNG